MALLPPVQLTAARLLTRNIEGIELEIGALSGGPWGLSLEALRLSGDGVSVELEQARLDFAFWSSLTQLKLDIESASVTEIAVRLARAEVVVPPPEPQSAAGTETAPGSADRSDALLSGRWLRELGARAVWPDWLVVRQATVTGRLDAALANEVEVGGRFDIALTEGSAGAAATVVLSGNAEASREAESLAALRFTGRAGAAIGRAGPIESLEATIAVIGQDDRRGLDGNVAIDLTAMSESFAFTLDTLDGTRLVDFDSENDDAGRLTTSWNLEIPSGVVATFARGRSTADLAASSTGRVVFDPADETTTVRARVDAVGSGWAAFDPRLQDVGTVSLRFEADVDIRGSEVTARTADLSLSSDLRGELLRIEALQPLRFDGTSWWLEPENPEAAVIQARLDAMPLRWLRHFDPSGLLIDGQLDFSFELVRESGRTVRLVAGEPLRASAVRLHNLPGAEAPEFDITLTPRIAFADGVLSADIESLTIAAANGLAVDFQGTARTSRASWPATEFDGELSARIPALQRIVPALDRLRGTAGMNFNFGTFLLSVAGASLAADGTDGREILSADLAGQEPLRIALPVFRPDWDSYEPQTLTLSLDRMPIGWLSPYIPELELRGGEVSGRLSATAVAGEGLSLSATEPLVVTDLLPVYRGREAHQTLRASLRPTLQLGNAASTLRLDEFSVATAQGDEIAGALRVEAAPGGETIAVNLSLDGRFPGLAARTGAQLGGLQLEQQGRLDPDSRRFNIDRLELTVTDTAGSTFLELANLQPFYVDPEPFAVGTDGAATKILRVAVTPLRLEQLLPSIFGLDLEGVLPAGELFGRTEPGGGLVIAAEAPLVFRDVSVRWEDAALLDRVTMSTRYEIAYSVAGVELRSASLSALNPAGETMLDLATEIVAPLMPDAAWSQASIALTTDLAALGGQPVLADLPAFTSGRFSASLMASNTGETSIHLDSSLRDAATTELGALPDAEIGVDATVTDASRIELSIPLALDSAAFGRSDLRLDGSLERTAQGPDRFRAAISGSHFAVADWLRLTQLLGFRDDTVAAPGGTRVVTAGDESPDLRSALGKLRTERHRVPVWTDNLEGSAGLAVDRLSFPSFEVERLAGRLELSPTRAELSGLTASLLGAGLTARGTLDFEAAADAPYSLDFDADIAAIDLGRLFRLLDPTALPTTEGIFDFAATLGGRGRNPIDLAFSTRGEIRLSGTDGVFRGLADIAGTGSTASRVIGTLTFSRELRALARLLEGLGEIPFDQAEIILSRQSGSNLDLQSLSLRSPQVSMQASGSLALAPRRSLLQSPLMLSADIAARGDVAILFDGMDLLEEETDNNEDDYRSLIRPIEILGTPAEPDASAFWALLDEGAENARGSFGLGLRTLNRQLEDGREAEQE